MLKPITNITRKAVVLGKPQENAFNEIKTKISSPLILHLPCSTGRFILQTDMSREHTSNSLWQIQEGCPKLIGYANKTLPPACKNYNITELEMTGLLVNIALWMVYLKQCEFDACVDHAGVVQILKTKTEPATNCITRLLDRFYPYNFNLYYVKGKDMILVGIG